MLSKTQILAFKLHKYLFFYIPYSIPIYFNQNYTTLHYKSLFPIYFSLFYLVFTALWIIYGVLRYSLFFPRDDFSILNIVLLLGASLVFLIASGFGFVIFKDFDFYLQILNDCLMMEQKLYLGKNK